MPKEVKALPVKEDKKKQEKVTTYGKDAKKVQKPAVEEKKIKEKKVLKKIEDFNKFTRIRAVKEAKKKKEIAEHITIDAASILKAVKCLQKFNTEKKEKSKFLLEEDDEFLYIEVTLSKLPEEYSIRPFQM